MVGTPSGRGHLEATQRRGNMAAMSSQPITLTDEQREFRAVVRQFAADKIAPLAAEIDRTGEYSWATFEALKAMELTALSYPEQYGGAGASLVDQAIAAEELARVCASTSLHVPDLQARDAAGAQLRLGRAEGRRTCRGSASGASQCSYALSASPTPAATWRR